MDILTLEASKRLEAAEIKRPKTNLIPDARFALPKDEMKTGFMGVFHWAYSGDARKTMIKIALAPILNTSLLSVGKMPAAKNAEQRQARKAKMAKLRAWENMRTSTHLNQYVALKKVNGSDPHFILNLPILILRGVEEIGSTLLMFSDLELTDDARTEAEQLVAQPTSHLYPPGPAIERSGVNAAAAQIFRQCLIGIRYETTDRHDILISLEFKIRKEEAQQMVSTEWLELRPIDLYPLFSTWVEAEYVSKAYGKSAISLSKIADTLPRHDPADERIDQYGITINMDGDPLLLPASLNATQKYESMLAESNLAPPGSFAMRQISSMSNPVLPINIPVLVDWVNGKFTYTNSVGKPVLLPLEHMRKCTASMAMNILRRDVSDEFVKRLEHYAVLVNVSISCAAYGATAVNDKLTVGQAFQEWYKTPDAEGMQTYKVLSFDSEDFSLQPVREFIRRLYPAMKANIETLNSAYAVSTMIEVMGKLAVIVEYGRDESGTITAANTINKKALDQGLDPNWKPEEAPLITKKFETEEGGLLPHQAKVRNVLRDSPDFAVLSVDAGGGKSMLAITDILYEIKAMRSAPYLIMCPSHLVANYVSEVVEFTDGKVNVIPVTSYNIRTTGIARYEAILKDSPINTVLIVDYDVLKFRAKATVYGTAAIAVYPVIEMIRQFKPGYVMCDESHFLRNMKSARTKSVLSLIADIPKKRLASGTINPDSPSDLPGQMALLDPTIFGTREDFNNKYGEDVRGNRVMKWRTKGRNSINEVLPTLKQNIVWTSAKRKEWACALPVRRDFYVPVELTPAQRRMYGAIFDDMIQQIRKDAESNKNAKKLLEKLTGEKATKEDEDDFGDLTEVEEGEDILDDAEDVGPALQPYLADIERFVTDPSSHPYSKNGIILSNGERVPPLTGDDLKAPKAEAVEGILRDYFATSKSKALIFVNYTQSAESLYNAMPDDLKASGLLYYASSKTEMVNRFKTDPDIKWMIGIRKSLEVGLNLQQAGCLIRCEGVWTPGEQEQGDARISRPYFGPGGDKRKAEGLYFYSVVADRTLDVTKAARLRAKMVALAKFENTNDPNYEAIPDIPIIPMNLETIQTQNDFNTNLAAYQDSMERLSTVIKNENSEYAAKIIAEGGFHFTQVKAAPVPASAALLARVPYAQGTELYKASELGLVRVDNYLGMDLSGEDDEDEGAATDDENDNSFIREQRAKVMGKRCHTEFGDGEIFGAAAIGATNFISRIHVKLDDGTTARGLRATNVFIITRTETNMKDMRMKLAQASGLQVTGEITVPGTVIKQTKLSVKEIRQKEKEEEIRQKKLSKEVKKLNKTLSLELQLNIVNGYMRFAYSGEDPRAVKSLEALGFKMDARYLYTRIRSYKQLIAQANAWADGGFEITNQVDNDTFHALAAELQGGSVNTHRHYSKLVGKANFQNYLRMVWKPSANKKLLNMFALVTDGGADDRINIQKAEKVGGNPDYGIVYLCLPLGQGHPASKAATSSRYKVPGLRWFQSTPTWSVFVGSMAGAHKVFDSIKEAGIVITNRDELNKAAKSVKRVTPKDDVVDVLED